MRMKRQRHEQCHRVREIKQTKAKMKKKKTTKRCFITINKKKRKKMKKGVEL